MSEPTLIPVNYEQCQAEHSNGVGPFTLGGVPKMVQCTNKPAFIAHENEPGEDGLKGAMSLCLDCAVVFKEQMDEDFATLVAITEGT
jgi:hypothetical protein